MALPKIQKIRLLLISEYREKVMESLQNLGILELISTEESKKETESTKTVKKLQKTELAQANIEFAIKTISPYAKKRGLFSAPIELNIEEAEEVVKNFKYKKVVKSCQEIEDKIVKTKNLITAIETKLDMLAPWRSLGIKLEDLEGSKTTSIFLGSIKTPLFNDFKDRLNELSKYIELEEIGEDQTNTNFTLIFEKKIERDLRKLSTEFKLSEAEFPEDAKGSVKKTIIDLKKELKEAKRSIKKETKNLKDLAKYNEKLQIAYDFYSWELEKLESLHELEETKYSLSISAWVPQIHLEKLENAIKKITNEYLLETIEADEDEVPPVIIKNNSFLAPFESVTNTYGLPLHTELDPTPFLSVFFIVFFALCLTDAGYGLIMFASMWAMQRFLKLPPEVKKFARLLMYGGFATMIVGAIFGGWFGITTENMPNFLTYISDSGEKLFILQKINAVTNPLAVLILALGLGFLQILLGVYIKLIHDYRNFSKKDALLDTAPWAYLLTMIGLYILIRAGVLPASLEPLGFILLMIGIAGIVLTQGHDKKGILGKAFSGVLGLYGLVGYMSDVLSYSRLLALGLATAIIGMAVNIIAVLLKDMVPYFGYVLMVLVFIGGHIFNLLINALGAFIHSGRLQFVEFFGKFMEGGGKAFKPLSKKSKYIYISDKK